MDTAHIATAASAVGRVRGTHPCKERADASRFFGVAYTKILKGGPPDEMASAEIDLKSLKKAIDAILDHLMDDLKMQSVAIDDSRNSYWHCPYSELYDLSKKPIGLDIGNLSDDADFVRLVERGQSGDVSYNFVHVAPLLRYIRRND